VDVGAERSSECFVAVGGVFLTRRNPGPARIAGLTFLLLGLGGSLSAQEGGAPNALDPRPANALTPDTVLTPSTGPRIVRLPAPGAAVLSMRLFIPVREGAAEAGAARVLEILGTESARAVANRIGALVEGARTPWGVAYTVTGAVSDADFLAFALRTAVGDPSGRQVDFVQAVAALQADVQRSQETPSGRIAARLREQAAPATPPLGGTRGSLGRMTLADVRALWSRTHQAERMTLVVAGDVPMEILLSAFQSIGAPATGAYGPSDAAISQPSRPAAQVIRHWYGEARVIPDASDPHAEVAALLVAQALEVSGGSYEAEVQLWQFPESKVLTVIGAAYSRNRQEMIRRVQEAITETIAALEDRTVHDAVARVRSGLLVSARMPAGRAEFVGLRMETDRNAMGARELLSELDSVTTASVRAFLQAQMGTDPLRAEVRP
jgi:predicted Zn-dependent peptidase